MLHAVEVESFGVDPNTGTPLVILKEKGGNRKLAVVIGPMEAGAIAMKSLNVETEKPLTIDLVKIVIERLGAKLDKVVLYDVSENVFLARLHVVMGTAALLIECRPPDALALALRNATPMYVDQLVFDKLTPAGESEAGKLKQNIRNIDTVEFGRYHLE
jgi:bifunctional DNase/RNase